MNETRTLYCDRCKASILLYEWKYLSDYVGNGYTQGGWQHIGPGAGMDPDTGIYPPCKAIRPVPRKINGPA